MLAASKILRTLNAPFELEDIVILPSVRIGIAMFPDHARHAESLVQFAESALADAEANNAPYSVYTDRALHDIADVWELENELDSALQNGEFEVHFQPKLDLHTRLLAGAEALVRWRSPKRGFVPPDLFIPLATRTGQLKPLTWSILNMALQHAAGWPTRFGPLTVAVNISPSLLDDDSLVSRVADAMAIWGTGPGRLTLEITESAVMRDPQASFDTIRTLHANGVAVSIDDFGTGYSSLANFRNIPATELKIDKGFVINMADSPADANIVRTIIGLAQAFHMRVAAEGVESVTAMNMLTAMGSDYAQGYYISQPLPAHVFTQFVNEFLPPLEWPIRKVGDAESALLHRPVVEAQGSRAIPH
jgi:EAL domain-containing protein (putative c-di-GMP-specific phosphodiesterase class I)